MRPTSGRVCARYGPPETEWVGYSGEFVYDVMATGGALYASVGRHAFAQPLIEEYMVHAAPIGSSVEISWNGGIPYFKFAE